MLSVWSLFTNVSGRIWGEGKTIFSLRFHLRYAVGLFGMYLLWVGVYDMIESFCLPEVRRFDRAVYFIAIGFSGCCITNSFEHISVCICKGNMDEEVVTENSSIIDRAGEGMRCFFAIVSQNFLWVAQWNLAGLDQYDVTTRANRWYVAFLIMLGIACLLWTRVYIASSWISYELNSDIWNAQDPWNSDMSILHFVRSILSVFGYITYMNAIWIVVDAYILPYRTLERNLVLVAVGILMTALSGTYSINVFDTPTDDVSLDDIEDDEDSNESGSNIFSESEDTQLLIKYDEDKPANYGVSTNYSLNEA
eukprot:m.273873 g.273873  ORF g.273873 m.273873 type:complete len:308 (-) comp16282_c7_seq36:141-1064(-)